MLYLITGDTKEYRTKIVASITAEAGSGDSIMLDDTTAAIIDLEQYAYPSLFSMTVPIVHARFMLGAKQEIIADMVKKLVASPTVFVLEDFSLLAAQTAVFKKHGAIIHAEPKRAAAAKPNMFALVEGVLLKNKKERWIAYQGVVRDHAIEAVLGILYWKVRDLLQKDTRNNQQWSALYTALLRAHANAWLKGIPLSLAIEKVLLEY